MLKIAGVKSEKEFYKKFPTEEAFMAKHGKELKKAQIGSYIGGAQDAGYQPIAFKDVYDQADYAITGSTEDQRKEEAYRQAELAAAQQSAGGLGEIVSNLGQAAQMAGEAAKKGKKIPKYQNAGSPLQSNLKPPSFGYNFNAPQFQQYKPMGLPDSRSQNVVSPSAYDITGVDRYYGNLPGGSTVQEVPGAGLAKAAEVLTPLGSIAGDIQALKEEKRMLQQAEQAKAVSDISLQAARTRPEQTERKYLRPEQVVNTGEEFFPIYGVGTNVLARNGASVGGGEIMNTYAPNTLYDDLGYEPLNESERYKQFYHGGKMHKAQDGFLTEFASAGGGDAASQLMTGITGRNAGGQIGGKLGKVAGTAIGGPIGGMIGQVGGQLIGSLVDRKPQKIKEAKEATQKNIQTMALQQGIPGAQKQYTSFMKDGGMTTSPYEWVSHTWQPQVITTFGEHKVKDLLKPPADADMLRAGGHLKEYTPPSAAAMSTERPDFQMGGELQIHWGGGAEPMSYNPYLPEGGETVMFRGQSHDESDGKGNTGIGITYGDNPVEVERGEPAMKMRDGSSGDSSLVVFGNLKIPKLLGDPKAEGKNFKKYVEELSKTEDKQNKLVDKSITAIDEMEVQTPFDRLKFNSLQANVMGANQKLKDIAQKKMDASALQTAMNDTIEEYGLKTTDKGNIMAKLGKTIMKAQAGADLPKLEQKDYEYLQGLYAAAEKAKTGPAVLKFQKEFNRLAKPYAEKILSSEPLTAYGKKKGYAASDVRSNEDALFGKRSQQYMSALKNTMEKSQTPAATETLPTITLTGMKDALPAEKEKEKEVIQPVGSKKFPWMTAFNQVIPYLRPTDAQPLDASQLYGEMYALSTNQLEPVRAQTFQPQLSVPYDISLQDILNENEASFRSQQRLFGYNPALQSQLGAQKYTANQRVLGEQFRMNQAMKDQVYRENRNLLNQAKLQNLAILDQQYERQEMAKSKTKATTQAALNSVAAKYAQNRLENRTLQVYENLYNYRFDPRFRAINMNPLVDFEAMIANASPAQLAEYRKVFEEKAKKSSTESVKNGSIVRSLKSI